MTLDVGGVEHRFGEWQLAKRSHCTGPENLTHLAVAMVVPLVQYLLKFVGFRDEYFLHQPTYIIGLFFIMLEASSCYFLRNLLALIL